MPEFSIKEPAMPVRIVEISPGELREYSRIPSKYEVKTILQVELIDRGLGGVLLRQAALENPYWKDYDALGDTPVEWPASFDVSRWGFFLAKDHGTPVGGAAVAFASPGVDMLDGRSDLSVLWDLRVRPDYQGVGIALFRHAVKWSRERGCLQMKVETQNTNLPACRFYQRMGCELGDIRRYGYAAEPKMKHETMLCWYLDLVRQEPPDGMVA
jgi:GNAT superfamily N-acetyltransferase